MSLIIGLDCDGTIAAYNRALGRHVARQLQLVLNAEEMTARYPDPASYNFADSWTDIKSFDEFKAFHVNAVDNGIYRELELFDKADIHLNQLSEDGHHIRVITSRFVKGGQHATVVADTAFWLDDKNIPYKDIMFTSRKTDIYADVYVDDSPENILAFIEADRPYIIFDGLYNRHLPGPRVDNWDDAYALITHFARTGNFDIS